MDGKDGSEDSEGGINFNTIIKRFGEMHYFYKF